MTTEMLATKQGVQLTNLTDMCALAKYAVDAGFTPKGIDTPAKAVIAMQYGFELGFTPLQAINSVVVISGKPTLAGDSAKAVIVNSGKLKSYKETTVGEKGTDSYGYKIVSARKDYESVIETIFTVADAKKAGLWENPNKKDTWGKYPERMLKYRALGFNLRDNFPDVLKGLVIKEEAEDYPQEASRDAEYTTIGDATEALKAEVGIEPAEVGVTDEHIDLIKARAFGNKMGKEDAFEFACYVIGRRPKSWHELTAAEAENVLETLNDKEAVKRFTGANLAEQGNLPI